MRSVYITDTAAFLPNEPIENDDMENVLGKVDGLSSRVRKIILRNNGIRQRYYAIDPKTGDMTHSNATLTAEAIRRLAPRSGFSPADIACLACGTSSPDQVMPGHGSMVHGALGGAPLEVVSTGGICVSGMTALKYAWLNVAAGEVENAVACGSELASSFLRGRYHEVRRTYSEEDLQKKPHLAFETEFLRWMLSDGAGAVYLSPEPKAGGLSLRVEWIDQLSYAHALETCMYAAAVKQPDGSLKGWREYPSAYEAQEAGAFAIQQDVKLLNERIVPLVINDVLAKVVEKRGLRSDDIDWYLPHYSSHYFREPIYQAMESIGFAIPYEKWFTNLATKGNTGAGSIYIILDELFKSGRLQRGQKVLCFIPESGRFSACYVLLSVV